MYWKIPTIKSQQGNENCSHEMYALYLFDTDKLLNTIGFQGFLHMIVGP